MKVLIAIPSKTRPDQLQKCALQWLNHSKYRGYVRVFVERQDAQSYAEVMDPEQIVQISESNRGLGYAKKMIKEWAENNGFDIIVKLDDDVNGWAKRGFKFHYINSALFFDEALNASLGKFKKYPDLAAISFPYRFELWEPKRWSAINARLQTVYIIRTKDFEGDERISTFEDFYQYLTIRLNNRFTLRYGAIGISCLPVGKQKGGLQEFNRDEMARAEIELFREIYPALKVRKVEGKQWSVEPQLTGELFGAKKL